MWGNPCACGYVNGHTTLRQVIRNCIYDDWEDLVILRPGDEPQLRKNTIRWMQLQAEGGSHRQAGPPKPWGQGWPASAPARANPVVVPAAPSIPPMPERPPPVPPNLVVDNLPVKAYPKWPPPVHVAILPTVVIHRAPPKAGNLLVNLAPEMMPLAQAEFAIQPGSGAGQPVIHQEATRPLPPKAPPPSVLPPSMLHLDDGTRSP